MAPTVTVTLRLAAAALVRARAGTVKVTGPGLRACTGSKFKFKLA